MAQIANSTSFNRYPEIFSTAKAVLSDRSSLRILSFGCSFGHEMVTLRRYFPDAEILGCDINREAMAAAELQKIGTVFHSSPENILANSPFDAIFAMSVLCINPPPENLAMAFPFSEFCEHVRTLDASLASGGIICFSNTNYRFEDTPVRNSYRGILSPQITSTGFVTLLSATGTPIERSFYPPRNIFEKKPGPDIEVDVGLTDVGPPPEGLAPVRNSRSKAR